MSLQFKRNTPRDYSNIKVLFEDTSQTSPKFFRVSDVPQVLTKGKNLLRISAHPSNLVPNSQIIVDIKDSNGDPIYFEVPDYLEQDKSRVISIWIYHDKDDENTANGDATISIYGISKVDQNGKPVPSRYRGKHNVKWSTTVNVDRDRENISPVIFKSDTLPTVSISESIEVYQNLPSTGSSLELTTQTGSGARYIYKGNTPIVQLTDGSEFNQEMVEYSLQLGNFSTPATPQTNFQNPTNITSYTSSVKELVNSTTVILNTPFTTTFDDRENLTHTFTSIESADYSISYFQTSSNIVTENQRSYANLTISNVNPISGYPNKLRILIKSDGLPGDYELINEVTVPFSSSLSVKIPIPSEHLEDPKRIKVQYLNSVGDISRTETITEPYKFEGGNYYFGGRKNLISGSMFISNAIGSGIEMGGVSSGFIRSVGYEGITSASLGKGPGGFIIYSGSGNLVVGEDQLDGVGVEFVGDNDDRHFIFTTANGGLLDVKTDKFFIGTADTQFISGSDGNIEISSSIFHLDPQQNLLVIGADAIINADLTVNNLRTPAIVNGSPSTRTNSSSSIDSDGFARFVSASIGGWDITTGSIEGGNLIMQPEGIIQTRDFATGLKGWKISSEGNGTAEFENVRIRGTMRTTTFEKESVNAVGGQLWVANSTTITGSVTPTDATMSVKNASGFSQGEILLIKKVDSTGFQTEYVLLQSASLDGDNSTEDEVYGRIMVTRGYGSGSQGDFVGDLASSAQAYEDGQVIVSTGKVDTGYIKMNANPNDTSTPYIDIVERTGSGLYDVGLKVRLGDLSGLANSSYVFGNSNPGFGLATDNVFLQGGIIANTGSIGGINMEAGKLYNGVGSWNNSNTGFYVDSTSNFSLGDKLTWDGTALIVRGQLQLADGTGVQDAINAVTESSTAKTLTIGVDSQVYAFDDVNDTTATPDTIVFTISQQNLSGTVTTSDITIRKDGGSTITTPTLGGVVTDGSGQLSGSLSFSGESLLKSDLPLTIDVSKDSLLDTTTIFKVEGGTAGADGTPGVDALTAFLTNESHTFPSDVNGNISSFVGGETDMVVFQGVNDVTTDYSFSRASTTSVSSSIVGNTVTITSMVHDSGSVIITATSASVSLSKTMSLAKSKQGSDGLDGTNAKTLVASVDSQVFAFDDSTDNSATPSSILFSFSQQNLSGTIAASDITITTDDSNSVTNFSFDNNSVSNGSGIVSGSVSYTGGFSSGGLNGSKDSLPLTISCTKDSLTDSIKVFRVEGGANGVNGADAVTTFLTNESHTFPSDVNGTIVSFVGGETDMIVFQGVTDVTTDYSFSRASTTSVSSSISDNTVTITSMAHDSGSVIITATSASVTLNKTMSLAKSKQGSDGLDGAAGANAKTLVASVDSQVFAFDDSSDTTATPTEVIFSFNQQNLSGTIGSGDITITTAQSTTVTGFSLDTNSVTDGSGIVSGSISFSGALSSGGLNSTKANLPVTISVSKDSLSDSVKVFRVEGGTDGADGADAVTTFLTNEAHTFAAATDGTIVSFVGGETDMEVFEGVTNKTSNYSFSKVDGTGVTSTISDNTVTVTGLSNDSGSIDITATSGSTSLTKTMSLVKSKQGVAGADGTSAKLLIGSLESQVFAFDDAADTTADPTSIIFSFQQQNLSGTIGSGDITVSTAGGSVTNFDFDNNDVSSGTGIVSGSISFSGALNAGGLNSTKSNLPVTITATKDGLTDSVKIFKVEGGAAGANGVSAITALLTNDSHTLPISSSNEVISFTGASTDIIVFQGTSDVTNDYTISRTSPAHMTTEVVGDTVTLTNSTTPFTGSIVITATSESVSLAKTMSISEARQGEAGADGADGADNQDFSWANENLTGVGPIESPGLLMTSNVFGFHNGIARDNGSLDEFTSYLDSDGNFYLGSGSSDAQFVWDNQTKELLVSGSNARIEVDKFFVGSLNNQYISGSNGIIEISSSNFHLSEEGDVTLSGTVTANAGEIGGFAITSTAISSSNDELILKSNGQITGSAVNLTGNINAEVGIFEDVEIIGQAVQSASLFLIESWATSSDALYNQHINGSGTTFSVGAEFSYGLLNWSSSYVDNGGSSTNIASTNLITKGYTQGGNYGDKKPPTFKQWWELTGDYDDYPNHGNDLYRPIECVEFSTPNSTDEYSITSDSIELPPDVASTTSLRGIALQTAVRFGSSIGFGSFYPIARVEVLASDGTTVLAKQEKAVQNASEWLDFSIPVSSELGFYASNQFNVRDEIKIRLTWTGPQSGGGGVITYVRWGELRLLKLADSPGISVSNITFRESGMSSGKNGTEHQGDFIPARDNFFDLGTNATGYVRRWDDVYATNGTIQTSDATEKTNITSSDLGLSFVNELRPVSYKWVGKTRTHYGLIAQEVSSSLDTFGKTTSDFAGITTGSLMGLRYNELISPMIKAIQELSDEINQLKLQLSQSKG